MNVRRCDRGQIQTRSFGRHYVHRRWTAHRRVGQSGSRNVNKEGPEPCAVTGRPARVFSRPCPVRARHVPCQASHSIAIYLPTLPSTPLHLHFDAASHNWASERITQGTSYRGRRLPPESRELGRWCENCPGHIVQPSFLWLWTGSPSPPPRHPSNLR